MLSAEQRTIRATGIGSSDIAAISDLDPHREPIDVWLEKLGLASGGETIAKWAGHRLEDPIANMYAERTGAVFAPAPGTVKHHVYPWALCTPDRVTTSGPAKVVEIKNVGGHMAHLWGDEPPTDKWLQVQWQLEVLQADRADLAALIGGTNFRVYAVHRDAELGAQLLSVAEWFWHEHVLARIPPPGSGEAMQRMAASLWPKSKDGLLPPTEEAEALRRKLLRAARAEKRIGDMRDRLESQVKGMIGDADGIDGCFTWRTDKTGKIAWEKVARELNPSQDLIDKHTGNPGRRFLVKAERTKAHGKR